MMEAKGSVTGPFLRNHLARSRVREVGSQDGVFRDGDEFDGRLDVFSQDALCDPRDHVALTGASNTDTARSFNVPD